MKRREFVVGSAVGSVALGAAYLGLPTLGAEAGAPAATRKILIAGGLFDTPFIRYMALLTAKRRPKLLFLPTASADSQSSTIGWFRSCSPLEVEPSVQESFIGSGRQTRGWDEVLLSVDGIVCSGGNTLNQQAIWRAQGIDVVLREAWNRGIALGGGGAGSLCWFEEGLRIRDQRSFPLSNVLDS